MVQKAEDMGLDTTVLKDVAHSGCDYPEPWTKSTAQEAHYMDFAIQHLLLIYFWNGFQSAMPLKSRAYWSPDKLTQMLLTTKSVKETE